MSEIKILIERLSIQLVQISNQMEEVKRGLGDLEKRIYLLENNREVADELSKNVFALDNAVHFLSSKTGSHEMKLINLERKFEEKNRRRVLHRTF